jgi:hemerythrin-like domain-containing protein
MTEHRLIVPMILGAGQRLAAFRQEGRVDSRYVEAASDFLRTYADRCHHGKEEDILFRALEKKTLNPGLRRLLDELVQEHAWSRRTVARLAESNEAYALGDQGRLGEVLTRLGQLVHFYPGHITKEESRFFRPSMAFLPEEEQHAILQEFVAFDKALIHERYRGVLAELNRGLDVQGGD